MNASGRRRAWVGRSGWLLLAGLALGCGHGAPAKPPPATPELEQVRGGRRASPNQRLADDLPRVGDDERPPFEADRLGLGAHRARQDAEHEQRRRRGRLPAADAGP